MSSSHVWHLLFGTLVWFVGPFSLGSALFGVVLSDYISSLVLAYYSKDCIDIRVGSKYELGTVGCHTGTGSSEQL